MSDRQAGGPARMLRRAVGVPQLQERLSEQDAAANEHRLALDNAVLALDQRMLDLYALVETVRAEVDLRLRQLAELVAANRADTEAVAQTLTSLESPLALLVSAEAARVDSYLVHQIAKLRHDLGLDRGPAQAGEPPADPASAG